MIDKLMVKFFLATKPNSKVIVKSYFTTLTGLKLNFEVSNYILKPTKP